MNSNITRNLLGIAAMLFALAMPLHAQASHCSTALTAGSWAYTYTGSVITANGPAPAASAGRYTQDTAGNVTGSQTRTVAGASGVEEISGTLSVNADCTGTATINVFVNGQLQRTTVLALVYDSNGNHLRMIFQSLTLPDGTNVPVVLTVDANRLVTKD
jgi:hypothetical protein